MTNYELLSKLSFNRIAGTKDEELAALIIKEEIAKAGGSSIYEEFEIDQANINKVSFDVLEPFVETFQVTGYKMTGSTPKEGIEGDFLYVGDALVQNLINANDKIVLVNSPITVETYKRLVKAKIKGFVTFSGSIYDNPSNTDLKTNQMRERLYKYGKIPGVTLRAKEAMDLVRKDPKRVRLTLLEDEFKATSRNVISEIKGTDFDNEVICFTAHYDSVEHSSGAFDNATGSVTIMALYKYFLENRPKRTLRFIWCGSEERGLLGSKDYCLKHKDNLEEVKLCINVDMTGVILGKDIAVVTGVDNIVSYINFLGLEKGFAIKAKQGVYSSDSTPFADAGIPAISFARVSADGGAEIHSRKDVIDNIDEVKMNDTFVFIKDFVSRVVNSICFPFEKKIPDIMKLDLDKYLGRKDDENK